MRRAWIATGMAVLLLTPTLRADVVLDANDRIESITNLTIDSAQYNATMHYGLTWTSFKSLAVTSITFSSQSDANLAANSIVAAVNGDADIALLFGTDNLNIPFTDQGTSASVVFLNHDPSTPYQNFPVNGTTVVNDDRVTGAEAWVAFAPVAVPEPSAVVFLGLATFGVGLWRAIRSGSRRLDSSDD